MLDRGMYRQHQYGGVRELLAGDARCLQAFGGMARRHPDVDNGQVRVVLAHQLHERGGIAGPAQDLEAGALQQARDSLAEEDVIVG